MSSLGTRVWDELERCSMFNPKFSSKESKKEVIISWLDDPSSSIEDFGVKQGSWRKLLNRNILVDKPKGQDWKVALYLLIGLRRCTLCKTLVDVCEFHEGQKACRPCQQKYREENRERQRIYTKQHYKDNIGKYKSKAAIRRAKLEKAKLYPWESEDIDELYSRCPPGHHVDHIIPLNGVLVTGLHVLNNLQYLPEEENRAKSNKFEIG